jgi:hypothetical protein
MTNKAYPTDVLKQARKTIDAWKKINPDLALGDLNPGEIEANLAKADANQSQVNTAKSQLTDLNNQHDDICMAVWNQVKRARSGMKAIYGDDSSQYEMIGGTRLSERKPRAARKTTTTTTTTS